MENKEITMADYIVDKLANEVKEQEQEVEEDEKTVSE